MTLRRICSRPASLQQQLQQHEESAIIIVIVIICDSPQPSEPQFLLTQLGAQPQAAELCVSITYSQGDFSYASRMPSRPAGRAALQNMVMVTERFSWSPVSGSAGQRLGSASQARQATCYGWKAKGEGKRRRESSGQTDKRGLSESR